MEAMWTLFLPTYRRFGELVERQRHGGPQHLYADFGYPVLSDHDRRFVARGPGAGVLLDRAVYPFALALKLFGPVESVTGSVDFTSQGVDQHAVVLLRHGAGSQSQIAVSLRVQLQNRVALSSASGLITIEPPAIGAELLTSLACASAEIESDPLVAAGFRARLGNALRRLPSLRRLNRLRRAPRLEHHSFGADPYLPMLTHFCELLRDGKSSSDVMPLSLSTDVLALVELTRQLPGNRTDRAGPRAQSPNDAAIARTTA
jgi:predicted dehydrogenase